MEERYRGQIEQDFNAYQNFNKCYLLTDDIFKSFEWNNLMISSKFKNQTPNHLKFENIPTSHLLLRIHNDMSINEFIQMIKNRFFFLSCNGIPIQSCEVYIIQHVQVE